MSLSPGKQFESDFAKSIDPEKAYIYRFKDSPSSWSQGSKTSFTPSNICDFLIFNDETKTMYLCELKSTKQPSLSLQNIRQSQIKQLTEASKHNLVAGFVVNFREKDNYTAFIEIGQFNQMMNSINKKSFNIKDLQENGSIQIENRKKRTRYCYDLDKFMTDIHR